MVSEGEGNIIVTAHTHDGPNGWDILSIKYSGADGSSLWQRRYNSPANQNDAALAVAVDRHGNVVITGPNHFG